MKKQHVAAVQESCVVCGCRCGSVNAWKLCERCQADAAAEILEYQEKLGTLYETDRRGYQAMMADKNMHMLFRVDSDGKREYETQTRRIYINTENGMPYVQSIYHSDVTIRPGSVSVGRPIVMSYHHVHYWARLKSEEIYKKYKGISKGNWPDYID